MRPDCQNPQHRADSPLPTAPSTKPYRKSFAVAAKSRFANPSTTKGNLRPLSLKGRARQHLGFSVCHVRLTIFKESVYVEFGRRNGSVLCSGQFSFSSTHNVPWIVDGNSTSSGTEHSATMRFAEVKYVFTSAFSQSSVASNGSAQVLESKISSLMENGELGQVLVEETQVNTSIIF